MIEIIGATHEGLIRSQNQDAYVYKVLSDRIAYAVVCDGMGGEKAGDVASRTACQVMDQVLSRDLTPQLGLSRVKAVLSTAVNAANAHVYEMAQEMEAYYGMGTTISAAVIYDSVICIAHAGDSRIYQISLSGRVRQLTRDHTIVNRLVERGEISEEQARNHPQKHLITKALGVMPNLDFDYLEQPYEEGTQLLLCSDGLSNYWDIEEIPSLVADFNREKDANIFVQYANGKGGSDNITAVLVLLDCAVNP